MKRDPNCYELVFKRKLNNKNFIFKLLYRFFFQKNEKSKILYYSAIIGYSF